MSYQMIARKWRPQKFKDFVGQSPVCRTLQNAIELGRIPHALLFVGARGTGKTSMARIVAKAIQCPKKTKEEPCGECTSCIEITESRSFDVLEIDGASHNGVETIKELIRRTIALPVGGHSGKKIYIIDEVHMLSLSAFNALLKTLEEPPEHILFIMATTESHKIPNTILSRCQRFDFHLLPLRDIVARLQWICNKEGIIIEEEVLWLLARQSGGSMRDSQSLLDQLVTFSNKNEIHKNLATELLGLSDQSLLMDFLSVLIAEKGVKKKRLVTLVQSITQKALEPKLFIQDLLLLIKNMLTVKLLSSEKEGLEMSAFLDLPASEIQFLLQLAKKQSPDHIHKLFHQGLELYKHLSQLQQPLLVFEVGLLSMGMEEEKKIEAESLLGTAQESSLTSSLSFSKEKESLLISSLNPSSLSSSQTVLEENPNENIKPTTSQDLKEPKKGVSSKEMKVYGRPQKPKKPMKSKGTQIDKVSFKEDEKEAKTQQQIALIKNMFNPKKERIKEVDKK